METMPPKQPEVPGVSTPEQQVEADNLRHGIAVLDLFSKEVAAEDERSNFLQRTSAGSESRAEILNGPSYKGDEVKLQRAITKMKNRFGINHLKRRAMQEHAGYLGIPAVIKRGKVVVEDPGELDRLQTEHGRWRQLFASRHRTEDRAAYRDFLESKMNALTSPKMELEMRPVIDGIEIVEGGPATNLEERAKRLIAAINAMAHRSKLSGFDVAAVADRHKDPIWDRYEDGTPKIHRAARNKRERLLEEEIKPDFWIASGFAALRGSGVMRERELRPRSRKMWEEFTGQFEHPPQQKYRVKVRKQLRKYLAAQENNSPASDSKAA